MLSNKAGMSILSGNILSIIAKFDEFSSFVDRVNTHNPISAILLQELWIDDIVIDLLALFNLKITTWSINPVDAVDMAVC